MLLAGCASHRAVDPKVTATLATGQVQLKGDDGQVLGMLRSTAEPPALVLLRPDGSQVPCGACRDELVQQSVGPGGRTARVEYRFCGATVDLATRVLISGAADDAIVLVVAGPQTVRVEWTGPNALRVHHVPIKDDDVYTRLRSSGDVTIVYSDELGGPDLDAVSMRTEAAALDTASFEYGARGRAAGMPVEMLERIAGWSQQSSGLYREEWGVWSGAPPYGDGPRGAAQIARGIHYVESGGNE
ncbi:MAG: hypothetical protein SF182_21580 [Deltaproteobacteria bacterium]|nr:hypothetical protein [Deltaproteobacteria bacterium]